MNTEIPNKTVEEKELIWLPKSLVKKIKDLDDPNNFIQQYLDDSKREIKASFETFDDEIIGYRANMIKVKSEFKKAADECISANYKVWEDFDKKRDELRIKVAAATEELSPMIQEFEKLTALINKVDGWKIERFLETLEKLKGHLYGEERNIIEFLVKNYKKE